MRFEGVLIENLAQGEVVNGIYILRKKELREASNRKLFLDLSFMDATGEISAKHWDVEESFFNELILNKL